jgi:16S rRNA (uracil1498-N3)-methyltransferase
VRVPWFVAEPDRWSGDLITLDAEESHHALKVLRVAPPDVVTVTDGRGRVARCSAEEVAEDHLVVRTLEVTEHRKPLPEVVVYQGAARGAKVDSAIERLSELGVSEVWVYSSSRSIVDWDERKVANLTRRWRSIARSAAKQSRSPWLPRAGGGLSFTELNRKIAREPYAVVLWEEASLPLRTAFVSEADRIALVVGPEGGLERTEAESLADAGAQLVSLGPRILRTENAPIVAATAILYHYGLIG